MLGTDVYPILKLKGISHLHHANSVVTSKAFLRLGGLASRGRVQRSGFPQTTQYTDVIDQRYGIWNDVFTDSVDIHERSKSHNKYGPVLFVLDARFLLELPDDVDILVTKTNPTKWHNGQSIQDRYFTSAQELEANLTYGTFDQMITFRTDEGIIPFGKWLECIKIDDPQLQNMDGSNVFKNALDSLQVTAMEINIEFPVNMRTCKKGCSCVKFYASNDMFIEKFF